MRGKSYLLSSTLIAALGGLLFGFDTAVISGTTTALKEVYDLGSFAMGFTVASALIGTIIGSDPGGSAGGSDWSTSYADRHRCALFRVGGRHGLCLGLVFVLVLSLFGRAGRRRRVGRVSDVHRRDFSGGLSRPPGGVTQFNIVLGILLAFFSNYVVAELELGATEWRWMFGVEAFPAAAFICPVVLHSVQPALAGGAGTCRRSARGVAATGERRARRREGTPEHCGVAGLCPSQHAGAAVLAGLHASP